MLIDVFARRRVELHRAFFGPPKEMLNPRHLVPCRGTLARGDADMLPAVILAAVDHDGQGRLPRALELEESEAVAAPGGPRAIADQAGVFYGLGE